MNSAKRMVLTLALGVAAWSSPLRAQPSEAPVATLSVERSQEAADCPNAEQLKQTVEAIAGRPLVDLGQDQPIQFRVALSRTAGKYRASLRASGDIEGTRSLESDADTCSELADGVALTLVIILEKHGVTLRERVELGPKPTQSVDTVGMRSVNRLPRRTTPAPPPSSPSPTKKKEARWTFGIGAAGTLGLLERAGAAEYLEVRHQLSRVFALDAFAFYAQSQVISADPGSVEIGLVGGSLAGCATQHASRHLALYGCVRMGVGSLNASASGYTETNTARRLWLSAGPSLIAQGKLIATLGWAAQVQGFGLLRRQTLSVEGIERESVYEPSRFGAFAGASLTLSI